MTIFKAISNNKKLILKIRQTHNAVHGGIALTSQPCHKKQTRCRTKNPVCDQTIGETAVVKAA